MILTLGNKVLKLEEWTRPYPAHKNRCRRIINSETCPGGSALINGPLLMVSWKGEDISNDKFHWLVQFWGPDLAFMNKVYEAHDHPKFRNYEYEDAQNYVDNFMTKMSKLIAFV